MTSTYAGYAPPEERPPLAAYATFATVFHAAMAGAVVAAKRSGRDLPDGVEAGDIALIGTASYTLSRLISKKSHPGDRRSIQVQITAKGTSALMAVVPAAARLQDLMLAPLSEDDRAHFLRCMRMIATTSSPPDADA